MSILEFFFLFLFYGKIELSMGFLLFFLFFSFFFFQQLCAARGQVELLPFRTQCFTRHCRRAFYLQCIFDNGFIILLNWHLNCLSSIGPWEKIYIFFFASNIKERMNYAFFGPMLDDGSRKCQEFFLIALIFCIINHSKFLFF